jgi:hypothetical protein
MTRSTVEAMQLEVERRMRRGERFTDVEDVINASGLTADDLADGDASLDVDRWANDGGTGTDQDGAVVEQRAGARR